LSIPRELEPLVVSLMKIAAITVTSSMLSLHSTHFRIFDF
jgi:hypothetical protein